MRGRKPTNLLGKRFGKLIVTDFVGTASRRAIWSVRCDCGGEKTALAGNLRQGHTRSCGCSPGGPPITNLEGRRFGNLVVKQFEDVKRGHAFWTCACDCGALKSIRGSHLLDGGTTSCGCYARIATVKRNQLRKGPKSHFWKGGVTAKSKVIRTSNEYKTWRKAVFIRDNFLCQKCGVAGEIQAHHIKAFAQFPELRFDVANGQTLCVPCHKETPNYAGKTK